MMKVPTFNFLGYKLHIYYAIVHEFSKKCICVAQFLCLSKTEFEKNTFIYPHKIILCGFLYLQTNVRIQNS